MTPEEADRLTEMLVQVINRGTGTAAYLDGYQAAGKTGTAENAEEYDHSWFVGFASTDKPDVAVAVILENVSGSARATPIGGKLMQAVLDKKYSGSISGNDYIYPPPTDTEPDNGDEINSDTEIVEDVVAPEDDYVIGSDQLPGFDDGEDDQSEVLGGDNQETGPPAGMTDNEGTEGSEETGSGSTGDGETAVPGRYSDEQGHQLVIVNK